jgi:Tfp pilus assembly protein PilF
MGRWTVRRRAASGAIGAAVLFLIGLSAEASAADKLDKGKDSGLRAHWRLDEGKGESLADASKHQQTGKMRGAPAWIAGKRGKALSFNGAQDCVILGNPQHLQIVGAITLSAWIRPRATDGFRNIIAHGYTDKSEVVLRVEAGKYSISSWEANPDTTHAATTPIPQGDLGQWVHLAGVYDGKMWKIYRNGELAQVSLDKVGALAVEADWAIGGRGNGEERFFSGDIDEVRIYDRGLSDKEVAELAALRDEPAQAGTTKRPPPATEIIPSQPLVVDRPPTTTKSPAETPKPAPVTAPEFLQRGIARQAAQDSRGAADDFTRAIELDAKLMPKALVRRASAHWAQSDVHAALTDCEEAISQQPDYAYAWLVRAQIKVESGDSSGAAKDLEQGAAKLTAGAEPGSYNLRASVLASLDQTAESLAAFRQAARQEQLPAEIDRAQWGIWVMRSRRGEHVEACDELKAWLDRRKKADDWFRNYAAFAAGEIKEAQLFENARQAGSADILIQAHYSAGLKRLFTGDRQGAREQFQAGAALGRKLGRRADDLEAELARLKKAE